MLPPDYLGTIPDAVLKLIYRTEEDILEDMARRIIQTEKWTRSTQWQQWRLEQLGLEKEAIRFHLQRLTGRAQGEINTIVQEAGRAALYYDDQIYRAFGLSPASPNVSPALLNLLNAGARQTNRTFQNLTATAVNTANQQFERVLDHAWMQISSGAFNYQTSIRRSIKELAVAGVQAIAYPSGHTDALDVAVRRAVLSGVNQTAARLSEARAEEMGCDLVEVTAHPGARPEHTHWQGKVFSRSGQSSKYPDFVRSTGYGTGPGLCGWNCRHSFFPFFEGLSESAYPRHKLREYEEKAVLYNGKHLSYYEATQQQRHIERQIRRWKREYIMLDAAGLDTTQASVKLSGWRAAEKEFCRQTDLGRDSFRSQAEGFGRRQASKAYWKNRKEVEKYSKIRYNKIGTIVITEDWKAKGKVSIPRKYKANAVIETKTSYKNGAVQIDRTIYGEDATMKTQIHSGPHNRPDQHQFGKRGEHAHDYSWGPDGELVNRNLRELTTEERTQHADILEGENDERQ